MDRLLLVVVFLGKTVLTSGAPLCNLWKGTHPLWTTDIHTETFCTDSNRTGRVFIRCSQDAVMVFNSPCVYGAYASSLSGAQCEQRTEDCVVPFEDMERKAQGHETYDISHYVQNKDQWKCKGKLLNSLQLQYTCVPRTMFRDMCNAVFRDENHIFLRKSEAAKDCQCEFTINPGTQGHLELLYLKTQTDSTIFQVSVDGSVLNKTHITPVPWIKPHMESSVIEADYGVQAKLSITANDPISGFCRDKTSAVSDSTPSPSTTKSAAPDLGNMQSQVAFATDLGISSVVSTSIFAIILFIIGAVLAVKKCRSARRNRGQRRTRGDQHREHLQLQPWSLEHDRPRDPPSLPLFPEIVYRPPTGANRPPRTDVMVRRDPEPPGGLPVPPPRRRRTGVNRPTRSDREAQRNPAQAPEYQRPVPPPYRNESMMRSSDDPGYVEPRRAAQSKSGFRNDGVRSMPKSSSSSGGRGSDDSHDSGIPNSPNHSDSDNRDKPTEPSYAFQRHPNLSDVRQPINGKTYGSINPLYTMYDDSKIPEKKRQRTYRGRQSSSKKKYQLKRLPSTPRGISSDEDKKSGGRSKNKKIETYVDILS